MPLNHNDWQQSVSACLQEVTTTPHRTSAWEFNDQILTNHCLARVHGKQLESQRRQSWQESQSPLSMSQLETSGVATNKAAGLHKWSMIHIYTVGGWMGVHMLSEQQRGLWVKANYRPLLVETGGFLALENVCNLLHSCLSFVEQWSDNSCITKC